MSSLDLIITFDTEDVYTPAEAGMDDIPKRLADILYEEGVPANFILIGDRARLLRERGREDVIASLGRHAIGAHALHQAQPYDAVLAAGLDWAGGLEVVRQMHGECYRIVGEVFDRPPVCLSAHACNCAPQQAVVAREFGLPYLYSYAAPPPLYNVCRSCGTLNFPCYDFDIAAAPYFEGFDDALSHEPSFTQHLQRFAEQIDLCLAAKQPLLLVHPCHPFKVYSLDWVDWYVSPNGTVIPPEEYPRRRKPGIRTAAQLDLAMRNFRRLARFISRHPHLNVITLPEATAKYGQVPETIGRLDLYAAAQRVCAQREVALDERFTPAELLLGMAAALLAFGREGALPESVARNNDCLGPVEDPLITPEEPGEAGWETLLGLAAALGEAPAVGHLPANLTLPGGGRIGLGSVYHALARAYVAVCEEGRPPDSVDLWRFDRQPRIGIEIGARYAALAESLLAEPNLNTSNLVRLGKLQTWTLAPAWNTVSL